MTRPAPFRVPYLILAVGLLCGAGCAQKIDSVSEFVELAHRHERASELPEAVSAYKKALELDPKFSTAWYDLGVAYVAMEQLTDAIDAYSKAIEIDPKLARAFNNRAAVYARLKQFDRAIADCDRAIELNPGDFLAWRNRGLARHDRGELKQALGDYDESIRINGKLAETYHYRGNVFLDQKQWNRALEDFDQAIRLDDSMAPVWLSRAIALARLGKQSDAVTSREKAVALGASADDLALADLTPKTEAPQSESGTAASPSDVKAPADLAQKAVDFVAGELKKEQLVLEPANHPWDLRQQGEKKGKHVVVRILAADQKESTVQFTTAELKEIQQSEVTTTLVIVRKVAPTSKAVDQAEFQIAKRIEAWKPDLAAMQPLTWSLPLTAETASTSAP